ncbi:protein of unknown function [Maridesulfovibrio hydrothermalis AM13 = DSM 14728]|uniref:Uncharacterized protein n=1 Tax=Maridesulfovibrio hydrothermalis AM13 = DSM 14728 TaxID=1121451 RepID=L0R645_9BACT|nr:protein of unknown function [Maridesulfovibrio hydrothermalis AM13 = DSM 14728]
MRYFLCRNLSDIGLMGYKVR